PENPILVVFTQDTLGEVAAEQTGWCEDLAQVLAPFGKDVNCLDGAVSAGSWTPPGHGRVLFPQMNAPEEWVRPRPVCGDASVLGVLKDSWDGFYTFGADNPQLGTGDNPPCNGRSPFHAGADTSYSFDEGIEDLPGIPEENRAAHLALA